MSTHLHRHNMLLLHQVYKMHAHYIAHLRMERGKLPEVEHQQIQSHIHSYTHLEYLNILNSVHILKN